MGSHAAYPLCMPVYEFRCRSCGEQFEELVRSSENPSCPACGAPDPERVFSAFSKPPKIGLRGAEARRSNAVRRAREEKRRERREQRRGRENG
jgi:putative FmdB family regulatory protein